MTAGQLFVFLACAWVALRVQASGDRCTDEAADGTCLLQGVKHGGAVGTKIDQRALLTQRGGDQRTEGCKTHVKMRIDNNLGTDLVMTYWTGVHGDCEVNKKTFKTKKDGKTQSVTELLGNGRTLAAYAYNSDSGGSGICNGAEGYMTFTPSDTSLGLNQMILKYRHPGGDDDGSYDINWNTGSYSQEAIDLYEDADHRKCDYQGKTETWYGVDVASCRSTMMCGTDSGLYHNACPPTIPGNRTFNSDTTGTKSGRHQDVTITLTINPPETTFSGYQGKWLYLGQGLADYSLWQTTSWSSSESTSYANSYTAGIRVAAEQKADFGFASASLTEELSFLYGRVATKTVTDTHGGETKITCGAMDCTGGLLYQWALQGHASDGTEQWVSDCSYVCVPDAIGYDLPKCPDGVCGEPSCQCCNQIWRSDTNDSVANYLCPKDTP